MSPAISASGALKSSRKAILDANQRWPAPSIPAGRTGNAPGDVRATDHVHSPTGPTRRQQNGLTIPQLSICRDRGDRADALCTPAALVAGPGRRRRPASPSHQGDPAPHRPNSRRPGSGSFRPRSKRASLHPPRSPQPGERIRARPGTGHHRRERSLLHPDGADNHCSACELWKSAPPRWSKPCGKVLHPDGARAASLLHSYGARTPRKCGAPGASRTC